MRLAYLFMSLVVVIVIASPASSQTVARATNDTLSIDAQNVPLGQLLRQVAREITIRKFLIDPGVEQTLVTVSCQGKTLPEALHAILLEAGVNFVIWGDRIYVGDPAVAVLVDHRVEQSQAEGTRMLKESEERRETGVANIEADVSPEEAEAEAQQRFEELLAAMTPQPDGPRVIGGVVGVPFPDASGEFPTSPWLPRPNRCP